MAGRDIKDILNQALFDGVECIIPFTSEDYLIFRVGGWWMMIFFNIRFLLNRMIKF